MNVLVIGGTLFIGRRLVSALLEAGHRVTILHRSPDHPFGQRVGSIRCDRNDPAAVRAALSPGGWDVVFDNVYDWERGTTAEQVEAAARACGDRLSRYVFMSSCAVYPEGLGHLESDSLVPGDDPNVYARNKASTERMLFGLHARYGFPVVTFRPPFVYGPENPFYREAFFWDRVRDGRPIIVPGDGSRLMHFVYVDDLVGACLRAMTEPAAIGQAFNIGNAEPVSQLELVDALARAAGVTPRVAHVPRERILAAGGNPMGDPLYFGVYFDLPSITENVDKVRRLIGIEPTGFVAGLERTYSWYLGHHRRPDNVYTFEDRLIAESQ